MQESYTLLDYHGKPWTRKGAGTYSNYGVDQAYGVFAMDGLKGDRAAHSKILGSVAYVLASDRFPAKQVFFVTKVDQVEIADTIVYIEPRENRVIKPFFLNNLQDGGAVSLQARRLTAIGGDASSFGSDWRTSAVSQASTYKSIPNVFSSHEGANICTRYIGGKRTSNPLWPWPMNHRILDATRRSGRAPVDVTKTIENMFGAIPLTCKAK
jgi:hypothetical protein